MSKVKYLYHVSYIGNGTHYGYRAKYLDKKITSPEDVTALNEQLEAEIGIVLVLTSISLLHELKEAE